MKNNKRNMSIMIILLLVVCLGIGYAAIVSNLEINGYSQMKSSSFDVHFENITVVNGSVKATTNATIEPTNRTRIDYAVTLEKPGDFYEFTVDVVNGGSLDAMISSVSSKLNGTEITTLPDYLEYNVTYEDGIEIEEYHELNATQEEKYKVRVAFKKDINPEDLPGTQSELNLSFSINYIQKDNNALVRPYYVYTTSGTYQYIGTQFNTTSSSNPEAAMSTFGNNFFLRHKVENNNIMETYIGFKLDGTIYYIRGGVPEGANPTKPIYDSNKSLLLKLFGSSNCNDYDSVGFIECSNGSISIKSNPIGYNSVWINDYRCSTTSGGDSRCIVP